MKTFTVKEFAKDFRLGEKAARNRIRKLMDDGEVEQLPSCVYPLKYTEKVKFNWHDPFNKCKRRK